MLRTIYRSSTSATHENATNTNQQRGERAGGEEGRHTMRAAIARIELDSKALTLRIVLSAHVREEATVW